MRTRPEREAKALLERLGIDTPPVDVEGIASHLGIRVEYDSLKESVSALLYRRGEKALILVSNEQPEVRQRFSVAHEIGHYLLHRDPVFVEKPPAQLSFRNVSSSLGSDSKEIEANSFAAALLLPSSWIYESVARRRTARRQRQKNS